MDDDVKEVYRQFRTTQDKIAYFLLAVAGSAIVLTIKRTETVTFSWCLIPLGLAVISWILSFYSGVMFLRYMASTLFANFKLLQIEAEQQAVSQGGRKAIEYNSKKILFYAHSQYLLLIVGVVLYITWHLIEMYIRSGFS